jgi:hypothetical protein
MKDEKGKTATAQAGTPMVPERRGTTEGAANTLTAVTHHDYSISARVVGTAVVGSWERTMPGRKVDVALETSEDVWWVADF